VSAAAQEHGRWAIEASGLGKSYGNLVAVAGIDLAVGPGEFFGLLGPNGAGKTTTIHMLATLLRPSRGSARVAGLDVAKAPLGVRGRIGIVFQETTLDLDLTAEENLRFAARLYGLKGARLRSRVAELFALFGLTERGNDRVRTFSGGMRRALDLARGLLHRPDVLLLDEPTLGLDPVHRRAIWQFLHRLRAEEQTTLFLTTHYLEEADGCDRVAIMASGRIAVEGTPDQLKRRFGRESIELEAPRVDEALLAEVQRRTGCAAVVGARGLQVLVEAADETLPALVPLLGGRVTSIRVRQPTLDDVFAAIVPGAPVPEVHR
jgi:ABC-2 type transport system ATP-binding protein